MRTHLSPLQYYRFNKLCKEAVEEYTRRVGNGVNDNEAADVVMTVLKRHFPSTGWVDKKQVIQMMSEGSSLRDFLAWWGYGKNIFVFTPELVEAFGQTDVEDIPTSVIRPPFSAFYLKFGHRTEIRTVPGSDRFLDGAYIFQWRNGITINYTQCSSDFQIGSMGLSFYLDLSTTDTIGSALTSGIHVADELSHQEMEDAKQHGTAYDFMQDTESDRQELKEIGLPIFREVTKLVINALAFILFEENSIREDWMGAPESMLDKLKKSSTPKEQFRNTSKLLALGFTKIRLCSARVDSGQGHETGHELRSHWRRGHWRRQPYGTGLAQIRLVWIRPTIVRADKGNPDHGHFYEGSRHPKSA